MKPSLILALLPMLASSCAQMEHKPVEDFYKPEGIPYYGGSHYLLVYSDGKGNVQTQILYLMDPHKKYVADPTSVCAKLDSKLTLQNGVLSNSEAAADPTALPKALLTAVKDIVVAGVANDPEQDSRRAVPAPSIFKILVESPTQVRLVGTESQHVVYVDVNAKQKEAQ